MGRSEETWQQELQAETRSTHLVSPTRRPQVRTPGLTILAHPDARRVGEEAPLPTLLDGHAALLSRLEPLFTAPGSERESRPLGVVQLSRRPMALTPDGDEPGHFLLDRSSSRTKVSVSGQVVETRYKLSPSDLETGAVLLLGHRVALCFHWLGAAPQELPSFGLVGASESLNRLRREIQLVADLDVPILLRGETGTGKELVAQAIHRAGKRSEGPYVALNIGAVPPSLAAAELFGASRGAFTGADRKREGFFERAHGGTLFLDEIGETPSEVQVHLLRALENHEIQPIGGSATRPVDVRILAATDADLEAASAAGSFRAPLLHRLAGYEVRIPPLRKRPGDVGRLLVHFLRMELDKLGDGDLLDRVEDPPWPPADVVARLALYPWPGNVRELQNIARRLVVARRADEDVLIDRWFQDPSEKPNKAQASAEASPPNDPPKPSRQAAKSYRPPHEVSDEELLHALRAHRFQLKPTATHLGISRASLYALIDRCPQIRRASQLEAPELETCRERHGGDLDAMAQELEVSRYGLQQRLRELGIGRPEDS